MAATLANPQTAVFPAAEVETCIRDALAHQAADQAVLRPANPRTAAGPSWEPEIDSLLAVEVICAVEQLLGIKLPATFPRRAATTVPRRASTTSCLRRRSPGPK